jgi:hypothetical protein
MSTFRASDEERERVAESLRGDLLAGRLTVEEYEERVARVYRSTTYAELDAIVVDPAMGAVQRAGPCSGAGRSSACGRSACESRRPSSRRS